MHVSQELDRLTKILRKQIIIHARCIVKFYKEDNIPKEDACGLYLEAVKESGDYKKMSDSIEGVLKDCVDKYKLERWFAESLFGFDLDKELKEGFNKAWSE